MQIIAETLSGIDLGPPVTSAGLTMFPLLSGRNGEPDYFTLDEALAGGLAAITEISESGSVPELRFVNKGDRPVLLVDGEELVGAKQNRILNLTILAPQRSELTLPVSCVERGRWSDRSGAVTTSHSAQFARARVNKTASVTSSLKETGRRNSDQLQTWHDIEGLLCNLAVQSRTSAMSDGYECYSSDLDESVRALSPVEGQAGAVFVVNHQIVGLDLFDHSSTFCKLLPKLVRSYAIESVRCAGADALPERSGASTVQRFLASVMEAKAESFNAVGEGEDLRIQETNLSGAGLVARGRLIHLCGFPIGRD
jgi:hypothetical protein